jgi:hypothetical protein
MSINRNRARLNKAKDNHQYRIIWINYEYPRYWDEMYHKYPRYKRGFKNPNKRIFSYQVRMYKTWKHNRKTQWRN